MKNTKRSSVVSKTKEALNNVKTMLDNGFSFILAASLLTVSGFGYYMLVKYGQDINQVLRYVYTAAQVIVAGTGFYQLGKFLNKK